jgi:uncharacterized membrane protein YgaE (UPF0421/DUF939 family)
MASASRTSLNWPLIEHSARTAVAATLSLLAARLLRMPEAYWAAISTLVVMQSTLGAALQISGQRFAGTAIGVAAGALLATCFGPNWVVFCAGVFILGLVCGLVRLERSGYRYAGIALAIVLLVVRNRSPWLVAAHRFVEVSAGIAVGLLMTVIWPERGEPA